MIFDRGPGDLFMVRVAGNFLSDYSLASLEYCVRFLGVPLLMVLGHTECGAVTSALKVVQERTILPGRLPFLIDAIEPAVHIAMSSKPDDLLNASIAENVRRQVNRLSTMSPVISDALEAGAVKIVGAIYDLDNGRVTLV
jgi:carbonic anhydrase